MRNKFNPLFLFVLIILVFFLSGCEYEDVYIATVTDTSPPPCNWSSKDVYTSSPKNIFVGSLKPTFNWHHTYNCTPDSYEITIVLRDDGQDPMTYGGPRLSLDTALNTHIYTVPGTETTFTIPISLQALSIYSWHIDAYHDGVKVNNPHQVQFWTPPACDYAVQAQFDLLVPADGAEVTRYDPLFQWQLTSLCLPERYVFEAATDPGFANIVLSMPGRNGPYTTFRPVIPANPAFRLPPCTDIYWHVAPAIEDSIGPWSETRTFTINDPAAPECQPGYVSPTPTPTPTATPTPTSTPAPVSEITFRSFFCLNKVTMGVSFIFPNPILGSYHAQVQGKWYSCEVLEGFNDILVCYGPRADKNTYADIILFDSRTDDVIFQNTWTVPTCSFSGDEGRSGEGACKTQTCPKCYVWNPAACQCEYDTFDTSCPPPP